MLIIVNMNTGIDLLLRCSPIVMKSSHVDEGQYMEHFCW